MLLDRRLIPALILLVQSVSAAVTITHAPSGHSSSNHVIENELPFANQTHEVVKVPNSNVVLVSQMSNSVLVKAMVNNKGAILKLQGFQIEKPTSALHGLTNSKAFPGKVWLTLQGENKLVLIDPKVDSVRAMPEVLKEISVPTPGNGPHYIGEYGDDLWVSLQQSYDVLRISHVDPSDYNIYHGVPRPIFVAQHPINKMFYTGQDDSSSVMKIDPKTGKTTQFQVPANIGQTPVGMISGPQGVWFTLLGNATHGTGTVGHIDANDKFTYHKLKSTFGKDASLLHLAFDLDVTENHTLWLLSSSIVDDDALNMIIKVKFDSEWKTIQSEDIFAMPTQGSQAHRILLTPTNVFATELASSKLLTYYNRRR
ncbi:hypothetical protein BGZ80_000063 [Entomortierella chlamydospora]|uniref:Uncharacterized protein n=1 Tax=Entomortierella chlamydospora TaxID=101097 RepID=A0A9P6MTH2_9FUNG|nr:hypothetical protein BGZ79_002194 [Entomortierella chlamydospora]KAG0012303.1 hypothetical protein BGZ80_000063 [Entomortierella chlamydospora]